MSERDSRAAPRGRILILCPYPQGTAPSQRFRFEQYIPRLEAAGFEVVEDPFWSDEAWRILYRPGHHAEKSLELARGFLRRLRAVLDARRFDWVFIHLEATPIGPPIIEAMLFILGRKVVFDIDDAIFMPPPAERSKRLFSRLKWRSKVRWVARRADKVIAVNPFLVSWAREVNEHTILVPTTIDPAYHRRPDDRPDNPVPVIGWTGTHSTIRYLDMLRPVLERLGTRARFELVVICDRDPGYSTIPGYRFVPWREASEIADLSRLDVGLMPVLDEPWARGKVGFKAIQYSALSIPPVVSDVGSGREVVEDGVTGLVVPNHEAAWLEALEKLVVDRALRERLGAAARERILSTYSVPAQAPVYASLFGVEA
ncbi:MAG: glycosyltransferase family 4 protein [Deltaproteobacteria bacterium]|nr:glycosyltransferase family 4 protein [Deltaproteobacteria bacterium]